MGSTPMAFLAGAEQAMAATMLSKTVTASRIMGSWELPSAQRARSLFSASVRRTPTAIPAPTLTTVEEKAIFKT